jgi:hypothetical protein
MQPPPTANAAATAEPDAQERASGREAAPANGDLGTGAAAAPGAAPAAAGLDVQVRAATSHRRHATRLANVAMQGRIVAVAPNEQPTSAAGSGGGAAAASSGALLKRGSTKIVYSKQEIHAVFAALMCGLFVGEARRAAPRVAVRHLKCGHMRQPPLTSRS